MSAPTWNGSCLPCTPAPVVHAVVCCHSKIGNLPFCTDVHGLQAGGPFTNLTYSPTDWHRRFYRLNTSSNVTANTASRTVDPITGTPTGELLTPGNEIAAFALATNHRVLASESYYEALASSVTTGTETTRWRLVPNSATVRQFAWMAPPANPPYDRAMADPEDNTYSIYWQSSAEVVQDVTITHQLTDEVTDEAVFARLQDLVDSIPWDILPPAASWSGYLFYGPSETPEVPEVKVRQSYHGNGSFEFRNSYFLYTGQGKSMVGPDSAASLNGDPFAPAYSGLAYPYEGAFPLFWSIRIKTNVPEQFTRKAVVRDTLADPIGQKLVSPWNGLLLLQRAGGGWEGFAYDHPDACAEQWGDGHPCTRQMWDLPNPTPAAVANRHYVYLFNQKCNGTSVPVRW